MLYVVIAHLPTRYIHLNLAVQRLRGLSQLGCTRWVFPTAEHSRFGHCVGTAHVAVAAARQLAATGLRVRPAEVELLEVAGEVAGGGSISSMR
jgi:HD superfamily phosphohydrolase